MRVGRGISAAIATHEALTTGVHGVGTSYLPKTSQSDQSLSDAEIPAAIARDAEVTTEITTHAAIATAHQDAPALIATHTSDVDAHARVATGSYTGDDTVGRAIAHGLGIVPRVVLIFSQSGNYVWGAIRGEIGGVFYNYDTADGIQTTTDSDATNFYVGNATEYELSMNKDTYVYRWVALG